MTRKTFDVGKLDELLARTEISKTNYSDSAQVHNSEKLYPVKPIRNVLPSRYRYQETVTSTHLS